VLPLALAACGGSSAKRVSGDPLGAAVQKTLAQGSEKVGLSGKVDLSGQSVAVAGDGAFDRAGGRLHLRLRLPAIGSTTVDELVVGKAIWISSPLLTSSLHGKRWLKLKGTRALGYDFGVFAGVTPTSALSVLRANTQPTLLGTDTLSGVSAKHYRSPLDTTIRGARFTSAEAWVDGQNLIRRVKLDFEATTGGSKTHTVLTIDYSDFGVAVTAAPPPADEVSA
jgi:hypothetical protein